MIKKITVNLSKETMKMIEELKNHDQIKKWNPNTSDIIRIAIANYWEDMNIPFADEQDRFYNNKS